MRLSEIPPSGLENYYCLQKVWEQEKMQQFKDFLLWYKNKDVVRILAAMQKMVEFYHNKGIEMLKLGCTLSKLASICVHKSISAHFFPFRESDKGLLSKVREDMVGGPFKMFTHKSVFDKTHKRKSTKVCKSFVGIDASQLYPHSMCQHMTLRLCTRYEFNADL